MVVLVLLCWALINLFTLYLLLVPIPLARAVLALLHCPEFLLHDPLNFAMGITMTAAIVHGVYRRIPRSDRWAAIWQSFLAMEVNAFLKGKHVSCHCAVLKR